MANQMVAMLGNQAQSAPPEPEGWQLMFKKLMGQTPESMGIHDFETADKAVRLTQQLRNVQAPPQTQNYAPASGYGTRNEAIYPER